MAHPNATDHCHRRLTVESGLPTTSAVMFALGVAGNVAALALLETRRRRRRRRRKRQSASPLFRVLVTALLATDLLGTIAVSPVVLAAYAQNTTLVALGDDGDRDVICAYFGFGMTFLSLSTLSILCAMALERFLSLGFPYFYDRRVAGGDERAVARRGYAAVALVYLACALYCACPFVGFGHYVQYCPGTWCFLDMSPPRSEPQNLVYTGIYACFTLLVIVCTVVCNVCVICLLVQMHRRQKTRHCRRHRHGVADVASRHKRVLFFRRSLSMSEEVEHLLPLVFITVAFCVCSFPLVLRVYINFMGWREERHASDLYALRMLSFNSIIDPWAFIIFQPSVLKLFWRTLVLRRQVRDEKPSRPHSSGQSRPRITSTMLDNCTTAATATATTITTGLQIHSDLGEPL